MLSMGLFRTDNVFEDRSILDKTLAERSREDSKKGDPQAMLICQMKRQLVDSVIDEQFAKYKEEGRFCEDEEEDSTDSIIDVEGDKDPCPYIKQALDDPVVVKKKEKPSWSVSDMIAKQPEQPKRQKARRKPQVPLCYRERREDWSPQVPRNPYEDMTRVPFIPFMPNYLMGPGPEINDFRNIYQQQFPYPAIHEGQTFCPPVQNGYYQRNEPVRPSHTPSSIGCHQFSIFGHRKSKVRPPRSSIDSSPLDVQNLVAQQPSAPSFFRWPADLQNNQPRKEIPVETMLNVPKNTPVKPLPSPPKTKYVPKFFQNLTKDSVDKYINDDIRILFKKPCEPAVQAKETNLVNVSVLPSEAVRAVDYPTSENCDRDESAECAVNNETVHVQNSCEAHSTKLDEDSAESIVVKEKVTLDNGSKTAVKTDFVGVIHSYIACLLDRGALDLSRATTSSSKLIQDKLNNVAIQCTCAARRKVNPSRSSAKAGILEPLPTSVTPSPPPPPPTPKAPQEQQQQQQVDNSSVFPQMFNDNFVMAACNNGNNFYNHPYFLERTRELNYRSNNFPEHFPSLPQNKLFENYQRVLTANLPPMSVPYPLSGKFLVPTMPPPNKRQRLFLDASFDKTSALCRV